MIAFVNLPVWLSFLIAVLLPTFAFYRLARWIQRRVKTGQEIFRGETAKVIGGYFMAIVGIILGLILVNALNDMQRADVSVVNEAQALIVVSRLLRQFPSEDRQRIHPLLLDYIDTVIQKEWPALRHGNSQDLSRDALDRLYVALTRVRDLQGAQVQTYGQVLTLMTRVSDLQRERSWLAAGTMPNIVWGLMLSISLLALGLVSVNTSPDARRHSVLIAAYTLTLFGILYVVGVLQFPFAGPIKVDSAPLEEAQAIIQKG